MEFLLENPRQALTVIAFCALIVSGLSVYLTLRSTSLQKQHNELAVRPVYWINLRDYETELSVAIENNGTGPMIFKELKVTRNGFNETKNNVIDWIKTETDWNTFVSIFDGRSLSPNKSLCILRLKGDPNDHGFANVRDLVRKELSELTITFRYTDIYKNEMPTFNRRLDWFSREK